ncbi:HEAT repeat domain-containing protein [Acetivibrio straminisolvens]|jgi:hypothetical protein|uniref:HEAT repeat protein n=2 Tax=Acetivibrio straminisolvens TaxID=253314 RepID=W4V0D4_9FIRM|nr:hypothetical protein [Acetivibrio straminisolvens]GAE86691.1 hypothetical protein JCM21531_10 [Acetivibrio straminisolvens JCM 21531]
MTELFDKSSAHYVLLQPVKLFGHPNAKDKIDLLNSLRNYADLGDIEYVYPLVFEKDTELAWTAAQIVSEVMGKVQGKQWNMVYDRVKYTNINIDRMSILLKFSPEVSVHLLGVASLNYNGYIREKALKLASGLSDSRIVPYILLRLNDWVLPVRNLALHILRSKFTTENFDAFIDNFYLVDKLQNALRVDLKSIREEIADYLKEDTMLNNLMLRLKNPNVKLRRFCYWLLEDKIADDDIINSALKDKSFEIHMWLVDAIKNLDEDRRDDVIEKLLQDKSAKVKTAVLRNYEEIVCLKFKERLVSLVADDNASVRDEARFICKKHSIIKDFPEFYRQQILINPVPGALIGLGETGNKSDYDIVCKFFNHEEPKFKVAAMTAMWYLSKDDTVKHVMDFLESDIPKIKKTAKKFLKNSKMPTVLFQMKDKLKGGNADIKLLALEIICGYGGWHALEGILFVIANNEGIVQNKAKELLNKWLIRATNIYYKPDEATGKRIQSLCDDIKKKNILLPSTLKELSFLIETRI